MKEIGYAESGPKNNPYYEEEGISSEKEQEKLPKEFLACEEIRMELLEKISSDIRLLDVFDPEYSPGELEGIIKKYNLIPRNNSKVVIEQLKNIEEKVKDNDSVISALKNMNYKLILSKSSFEEAKENIIKHLILAFVQKH